MYYNSILSFLLFEFAAFMNFFILSDFEMHYQHFFCVMFLYLLE